jgi:hypothetical protein
MAKYTKGFGDEIESKHSFLSSDKWTIRVNYSDIERFVKIFYTRIWKIMEKSSTISEVHI